MDFFVHYNFLDSPTQVCSNESKNFNHSNLDQPHAVFFLFHPNFLVLYFLRLIFFSGGSFWPNLFTYQLPPIACNKDWCFPFWLGGLGSSAGTFRNMFSQKQYKYDSVLVNFVLRLLANNQWNLWLHQAKIMLLLLNLMVVDNHQHWFNSHVLMD